MNIKVIIAGNCMMYGEPIKIVTRKDDNKIPNIFFCQKCEKRRKENKL